MRACMLCDLRQQRRVKSPNVRSTVPSCMHASAFPACCMLQGCTAEIIHSYFPYKPPSSPKRASGAVHCFMIHTNRVLNFHFRYQTLADGELIRRSWWRQV